MSLEELPDPPAVAKEVPASSVSSVLGNVGLDGLGQSLHDQRHLRSEDTLLVGRAVTLFRKEIMMPTDIQMGIAQVSSVHRDQPLPIADVTTHVCIPSV